MAREPKRITFVIPAEMAPQLEQIQKERFADCTQSQMIRTLLQAGFEAMQASPVHPPDEKRRRPFSSTKLE